MTISMVLFIDAITLLQLLLKKTNNNDTFGVQHHYYKVFTTKTKLK
jgi:hypothetical protein